MTARRPLPGGKHSKPNSAIDRRAVLLRMSTIVAAAALAAPATAMGSPREEQDPRPTVGQSRLRKIATEEAFSLPEVAEAMRDVVRRGGTNLDLKLLALIYDAASETSRSVQWQSAVASGANNRDTLARTLLPRLLDLDTGRISEMDANGVDMHVLSLGAPGVQMFDADEAIALARVSNDRLSEAVRRHPTRFSGLACFAPQDPRAAATEMERAINTLKLNGFLVNSHTQDVYLDDPRCWPILEAAEACPNCHKRLDHLRDVATIRRARAILLHKAAATLLNTKGTTDEQFLLVCERIAAARAHRKTINQQRLTEAA